jgi:hypothetical protein
MIDNKPNPVKNVSNWQKTEHSLSMGTKLAVAAQGMTIARHAIMHIANMKYVNIAHVNVIIAIASLIFSFVSITFLFLFDDDILYINVCIKSILIFYRL